MKEYINRLSFLKKIRILYISLLLIPVLFLGGFVIYSTSSFVRQNEMTEIEDTINRNVIELENRIQQCESSMRYLASNYSLQEFLKLDKTKYRERNSMAKYVGPLVYNTLLSNQFFSKIRLFSSENDAALSDIIKSADAVAQEDWYQKTMGTEEMQWWCEEGKWFASRQIVNYYPKDHLGIIRIEIKESMWEDTFDIFDDILIEMDIIASDQILHTYSIQGEESLGECYQIEKELSIPDWSICYRVSKKNLHSYFHPFMMNAMLIMIGLLIFVGFAVNEMSRRLLKNLHELVGEVKQVEDGNLMIPINISSKDEIGDLARSIDKMLKKINSLIEQVYKAELDKKDFELNLLQSKISPHFLYNNLSAINWIAIEKGETQIYEITTLMATFYRTALNRGVNIDRLRIEIDNIKAYVKLQQLSHDDSFDVEYHVEESLLECYVPIFIMQPLVENAIEHGIDQLREGRGKIFIEVLRETGCIIIRIKDNGQELYTRMGTAILPEEKYGYGVSNVHKRIQLLFGKGYGVKIYVDETGTTSEIRLKIDNMISMNT